MKTSSVDGFKFRDKNETGDGDLFESFTGLALASSENADKTILENPETKVYPPYSMSRYSFAVLFLMSNYSDRNKKKVFLGGSREW